MAGIYDSGAKIMADLVDQIANTLISSADPITGGFYWSNADATWNTTTRTGNSARRALVYNNPTTIPAESPIYLALEVINTSTQVKANYSGGYTYYTQSKGLRATFSPTWDSTGHTYSGTYQQSFIQYESASYSYQNSNPGVGGDLATIMMTYYMWIESNGFVLITRPEPTGDPYQQSFILVVERNTTKRYADGQSNFYAFCWANIFQSAWDAYPTAKHRTVMRPFAQQYPDTGNYDTETLSGAGISFLPLPNYYAYKSIGNGKVYYIKPILHNHSGQMNPIMQTQLFFLWTESVGLIDGDIIAIQGQPVKYLCKSVDSPDSATRLTFAMKYLG